MNKKEISEIKKLFCAEKCAISKICGCYVDFEKNIKTRINEPFLAISQEESSKYFNIFKATLSGTIGKNLLNMEFPMASELEGGTQEFLLKLRNSKLQDNELIEQFYQKIIDAYNYGENYYIILIYQAYDIPGKASDGTYMDDASEAVYSHILCSICPVNLSKSALCYNESTNNIEERIRDWVVDSPMHGFVFPAFNDRNTDIHSLLYYSKNPEILQLEFIDTMLGCSIPLTSKGQKEAFLSIVEETLQEECSFENVKAIHEQLNEIVQESKESPTPMILEKNDVKRLLEASGVSDEKLEDFDNAYEEEVEDNTQFAITNIASARSFEIKTSDIAIKINPDKTHLVDTKTIEGRNYVMIDITDYEVSINGINIKGMSH